MLLRFSLEEGYRWYELRTRGIDKNPFKEVALLDTNILLHGKFSEKTAKITYLPTLVKHKEKICSSMEKWRLQKSDTIPCVTDFTYIEALNVSRDLGFEEEMKSWLESFSRKHNSLCLQLKTPFCNKREGKWGMYLPRDLNKEFKERAEVEDKTLEARDKSLVATALYILYFTGLKPKIISDDRDFHHMSGSIKIYKNGDGDCVDILRSVEFAESLKLPLEI